MKKKTKKEKQKQIIEQDSWIYILLLSTLIILIESLKNYTFALEQLNLTYAIFLLPLVYLLSNYITKKYGYQKSLVAISVSGIALIAFVILMDFALGKAIDFSSVSGGFCAYVMSQLINLMIYNFLMHNTKMPWYLVFLNYMFALIVFYMIYTLIYLNMLILDNFWLAYFSTLLLQAMICGVITFIDHYITIGIDLE